MFSLVLMLFRPSSWNKKAHKAPSQENENQGDLFFYCCAFSWLLHLFSIVLSTRKKKHGVDFLRRTLEPHFSHSHVCVSVCLCVCVSADVGRWSQRSRKRRITRLHRVCVCLILYIHSDGVCLWVSVVCVGVSLWVCVSYVYVCRLVF